MKTFLKYLYEVIAIVLGITLSFIVDEWRHDRLEQDEEKKILNEITYGLKSDLVDIKRAQHWYTNQLAYLDTLEQMLEIPEYTPEFDRIIGKSLHTTSFIPHMGVYEDLKQRGISLIKEPQLRSKITTLYDRVLVLPKLQEDYYVKHLSNLLMTYCLQNFDKYGPFKANKTYETFVTDRMKPNNYQQLRMDPEFTALINTYRNMLSMQLTGCNIVISQCEQTLDEINDYLSD